MTNSADHYSLGTIWFEEYWCERVNLEQRSLNRDGSLQYHLSLTYYVISATLQQYIFSFSFVNI